MTTLQEYLNQQYPAQEDKNKVKKIIIDKSNPLPEIDGGELNLSEYPNLETLVIGGEHLKSKLSSLSVSSCSKLKELNCCCNQLKELSLAGLTNLKKIECDDNLLTNFD